MDVEFRRRAKQIFEAAIDLPANERESFLAAECGSNAGMRSEVERLLHATESIMGDFLQAPPLRCRSTKPPKRIGPYKILSVLGEGGMGVVFEAMQERPQRRVALKVLRVGLASPSALHRFAREAEILGRLRHQAIAQIYEAGTHNDGSSDVPYFAMELIPDAQPITKYAATHELTKRQRLQLFTRVCDGVQHGHRNGIIHRDLKPSNILVDSSEHPKLIDFGVARATEAGLTIATMRTDAGQMVGTLRYMSPEQCTGDVAEIDTRSDVYALGVVLFELLTGELPYDMASVTPFDIPRVIREEVPRTPSGVDRALRGDVETIVLRALEKDRERRYQSAADLAEDIRRYLAGEPIMARRDSGWYVLRKTLLRHRVPVGVATAFLLLTLASAIGLGILYREADAERTLAVNRAEALRRSAYCNTIALAQHSYEVQNTIQLIGLLQECPVDLRGWEWHYLKRLSDTSTTTLRGHEEKVFSVKFSPLGTLFASGSFDGTIKLWDWQSQLAGSTTGKASLQVGKEIRTLTGYGGWNTSPCFSPDGAQLAGASDDWQSQLAGRSLLIWDIETGDVLHTLTGHDDLVATCSYSPNGEQIATGSFDGTIKLWDIGSEEVRKTFCGHEKGRIAVIWSHDGRTIVSAGWDSTVRVWDIESSSAKHVIHHGERVLGLAIHPDGTKIASNSWDDTIRISDLETGALVREIPYKAVAGAGTVGIAFSPDGETIASGIEENLKIWRWKTGRLEATRHGHLDHIADVAYSPDGTRIVSSSHDATLKIWWAQPTKDSLVLRGHTNKVIDVAVSVDGRRIISASHDGTIRIWDAATGAALRTIEGGVGIITKLALSPKGDRIAYGGETGVVHISEMSTGETLRPARWHCQTAGGHDGGVHGVAYGPAGNLIASIGPDAVVRIWDAQTGEPLKELHSGHAGNDSALAFSPDGERLVTAGANNALQLWDVADGRQIAELKGHTAIVDAVRFSPDGRLIAAGSRDRTVYLWQADTGVLLQKLKGHKAMVQSVAFSPDGRRIVSGALDKLIKIWAVDSGKLVLTLKGHRGGIPGIAFSRDGQWIVSASSDRTLRVWRAASMN